MRLQARRSRAWVPVVAGLLAGQFASHTAAEVRHISTKLDSAATAELILVGSWGSGHGQFGREEEAARTGPTDFTATVDMLYVLDPINARVQMFGLDGTYRAEIPIGTRTADFLCVDDAGAITVLDAFKQRELRTFAPSGALRLRVDVPDSIGPCSAIWSDNARFWLEERHRRVHELALETDARGTRANAVAILPGRPIGRERATVQARRAGMRNVVINGVNRRTLRYDRSVSSIVALESDAHDRMYLAVACPCDERGNPWHTELVLTVFEANGRTAGSIHMPNQYVTDHYRKICVTPSGEVIQMQTTEEGVRFVRWSWDPNATQGAQR